MRVILALTPALLYLPVVEDSEVKNDILISYWYSRTSKSTFDEMLNGCIRAKKKMILDSGVFTARKRGITIPLQEYLDYCIRFKDKIEYFFNLDMGSTEEQISNFKTLVKNRVPTIGIVSNKMSFDEVRRFIDIYPYIGISYSAIGGTSSSKDYHIS